MAEQIDKKALRKRLFVDPKVQGALVARVVLYWVVCLCTISMMLLCWRIITGPARMFYTHFSDMWFFYGPALIASFILLPLIVIDIVRLSNRFTGPLLRLRRCMRELARGEHVEPIEFRDDDFWHDIAEAFNGVIHRVQNADAHPAEETAAEEEPVGAAED